MSQIFNEKNILPLIECFILSSMLLLITFSFVLIYILGFDTSFIPIMVILCIVGLISHFIFYYALKRKYNSEMNVFLYGVGFVSCCVTLVYCILGILHGPGGVSIKSILWYFYIFPFTFLYYSYATLLQSSEKGIDRVTLYLAAMFFISAAVLTIIEIMLYGIPFAGFFLLLFGLYCAYCLIRKKGILSIQVFAWTPFLPTFIIFWSAFITRLLTTSII